MCLGGNKGASSPLIGKHSHLTPRHCLDTASSVTFRTCHAMPCPVLCCSLVTLKIATSTATATATSTTTSTSTWGLSHIHGHSSTFSLPFRHSSPLLTSHNHFTYSYCIRQYIHLFSYFFNSVCVCIRFNLICCFNTSHGCHNRLPASRSGDRGSTGMVRSSQHFLRRSGHR